MTHTEKVPSVPETIICEKDADGVRCDGGHGALGHPAVWYSFDGQDEVQCGYCGRLFVKERGAELAE